MTCLETEAPACVPLQTTSLYINACNGILFGGIRAQIVCNVHITHTHTLPHAHALGKPQELSVGGWGAMVFVCFEKFCIHLGLIKVCFVFVVNEGCGNRQQQRRILQIESVRERAHRASELCRRK